MLDLESRKDKFEILHGNKTIAILMGTYNGEQFIEEQLSSILAQNYVCWKIFISDDGSTDGTIEILKKFQDNFGRDRIEIIYGPRLGPTQNFLSLVKKTSEQYHYFAFCDQDDRWSPDKLTIATEILNNFGNATPALYCGATKYIDSSGKFIQNSFIFPRKPSFVNSLVQSIAGGNTMVFNREAAKLLAKVPVEIGLIAHDWFLYIIVSAHHGNIFYDKNPLVEYRQHSLALVGENRTLRAKINRIQKLLDGRFREWNGENFKALGIFRAELSKEKQASLILFGDMRSNQIFVRLFAFLISGIRRQTLFGNMALFIAVLLRKV